MQTFINTEIYLNESNFTYFLRFQKDFLNFAFTYLLCLDVKDASLRVLSLIARYILVLSMINKSNGSNPFRNKSIIMVNWKKNVLKKSYTPSRVVSWVMYKNRIKIAKMNERSFYFSKFLLFYLALVEKFKISYTF